MKPSPKAVLLSSASMPAVRTVTHQDTHANPYQSNTQNKESISQIMLHLTEA